jgi:hypothetical protein
LYPKSKIFPFKFAVRKIVVKSRSFAEMGPANQMNI